MIKSEDKLKLTTISQKFEDGMYAPEQNGFYRLYHDIKLVCTMLIHYYSQGTRNYQMVDKFYKFATELILRECYKVGISLSNSKAGPSLVTDVETELDSVIAHDFIKISTNYKIPVAETYYIKTRELDLFSSMIAKSNLDHRPQELPNSNFEINKVIPQTNICEEAPKLGFVAANTSNIPDPTLPPTEMMTRFLHPNWYALPTTMWLKYGDYKPWAPSFNENGTVIDSTTRGIIWLQRVGYLQIYQDAEKNAAEDKKEESNELVDIKESEDDVHEGKDQLELLNGESSPVDSKEEANDEDQKAASDDVEKPNPVEQHSIKLENLFDWKPSNYIDDDEIEGFKDGTQASLVTSILLKIRNLRKERVMNKIIKPSAEEIKLYNKARRLLKEVVLAKQVKQLPMKHCRSFPVLQANYNGSIPVVRLQPTRKRKSKK